MSKSKKKVNLPSLVESQNIFEESFIKIRRDQLQIAQDPPYSYYSLITYPLSVAVLASTAEGAFILNEEYRHPTGHILLGCPGGFVEAHEDPIQAAQRELFEETGYQAQSFTIMGDAFPYAGFTGQKTIYIRAHQALLKAKPALEKSEVIQSRLLTLKEIMKMIHQGVEVDGVLCTALFFYQFYEFFNFS